MTAMRSSVDHYCVGELRDLLLHDGTFREQKMHCFRSASLYLILVYASHRRRQATVMAQSIRSKLPASCKSLRLLLAGSFIYSRIEADQNLTDNVTIATAGAADGKELLLAASRDIQAIEAFFSSFAGRQNAGNVSLQR